MLFYLSTTAIAIITALFLGIVFKPGVGLDMSNMMSGEVTIGESKSLVDIILNIKLLHKLLKISLTLN